MSIFYFEMRKQFLKLPILICLIVFSLINIYKLADTSRIYGRFSGEEMVKVKAAYDEFYSIQLRGEITQSKINFVMNTYRSLEKEIEGFNFSTEYDESRYTGYVYGDYGLFKFYIIPELEYAYMYPTRIDSILQKANENLTFFLKAGNQFSIRDNQKILNLYSGRKIANYTKTEGWERFFCYEFSVLLGMLMLVLGLSPVFSREKDTGMEVLLKTSKFGGNKTLYTKIISGNVFILTITIFFFTMDIIVFYTDYKMDGLLLPLYAVEYFSLTPMNTTILEFVIITFFLKLLAFAVIGNTMMLFSAILKNTIMCIFSNSLLVCFMGLISELFPQALLNPVTLLVAHRLLGGYKSYNICGLPISRLTFGTAIMLMMLVALFAAISGLMLKKRRAKKGVNA